MSENELVSYVSKLNDRELQNQRATGLSIWAILASGGLISLDLVDRSLNLLSLSIKLDWFLIIQALTFNIVTAILLYFLGLIFYVGGGYARRLETVLKKQSGLLVKIPLVLIFASIIIVYILASISSFRYWSLISYHLLTALLFSLNIGVDFVKSVQKKRESSSRLPNPVQLATKERRSAAYQCWLLSFLLISLAAAAVLIAFSSSSIIANASQILRQVVFGIELYSLLILHLLFFVVLHRRYQSLWLLELEKDIYLRDLSEPKILNRLEKELFGPPVVKWMKKREKEIQEHCSQLAFTCKSLLSDFQKSPECERKEAVKTLCSGIVDALNDVNKKRDEINSGLNSITGKGSLEMEEIEAERSLKISITKTKILIAQSASEICMECTKAGLKNNCQEPVVELLGRLK